MFKSALQYKKYKRKILKWHGIIYIKCKIKYYIIVMINVFDVIVWLKKRIWGEDGLCGLNLTTELDTFGGGGNGKGWEVRRF